MPRLTFALFAVAVLAAPSAVLAAAAAPSVWTASNPDANGCWTASDGTLCCKDDADSPEACAAPEAPALQAVVPSGSGGGGAAVPKSRSGGAARSLGGGARPSSAGKAASPAQAKTPPVTSFPPFSVDLLFKNYDNLAALPERVGGHGILRFRGPRDAYAIGLWAAEAADGDLRQDCAALRPKPGASAESACEGWLWISEKPAGQPVANCAKGPDEDYPSVGMGICYFVRGAGNSAAVGRHACVLEGGKKYYGNAATSGWNAAENPPAVCDTAVVAPFGNDEKAK